LENDLIQINNLNKQLLNSNYKKYINEASLGLLKKSDIGHAMRIYYYLSPQDLLLLLKENRNTINLKDYLNISSYLTIQLESTQLNNNNKLPDCSLLLTQLNNYEFNKCPFDSFKQFKGVDVPSTYLIKLNKPLVITSNTLNLLQSILGTRILLNNNNNNNEINNDHYLNTQKQMSFLKLLAKLAHNNNETDKLNDTYCVVSLF
jgi:hypothetical protein